MIDLNTLDAEKLKSGSQILTTVIGLIINFKKERKNKTDSTHRDFMEWLEYHRHEEIRNAIAGTQAVQEEVNNLLRDDHAQILAKLDSIDGVLTQVICKLSGFEVLAQQLGNDSQSGLKLSEQALGILYIFNQTPANQFTYIESHGTIGFDPTGGAMKVQEPKFILDDIAILLMFGFIRVADYKGDNTFYSLTRDGARYASEMNFKPIVKPSDPI